MSVNKNLLCRGCGVRYGTIPGSLCSQCAGPGQAEQMKAAGISMASEWRGIDRREYEESKKDNQTNG